MQRLLRSIVFTVLSFTAFYALADADQVVHEARTIKYSSKDIVRISTRPRFTTLILLPANERILDFVIGDKDAWVLEGTQNFAYLKPSKPGLETSMDLITAAGNIYTFYCVSADTAQPDLKLFVEPSDEKLLSAASGPPHLVPASEVDQFQQAAQLQVKAAEEQTNRFRADYAVHTLRFDYRFKKNKKPFKLKTIYHDDKFTYIQCSAREKPAFYEIKDGQSTLVNFTLEDGVYVIDHVVDKGYLAIGRHKTSFERLGDFI